MIILLWSSIFVKFWEMQISHASIYIDPTYRCGAYA